MNTAQDILELLKNVVHDKSRPDGFDYMSMWEAVLDARENKNETLLDFFARKGFCEVRQCCADMCIHVVPRIDPKQIQDVGFDWEVCPVIVQLWIESDFNSADTLQKVKAHNFQQ